MSKSNVRVKGVYPAKSFGRSGEIATILTIGVVVFLGLTTLVSTLFLNKNQTTSSKAAAPSSCNIPGQYFTECMEPRQRQSCKEDAGIALVYQCENNKYVMKYPECQTACKPNATPAPTVAGCNKGQVVDSCVREDCDTAVGKIMCVESYYDNNCSLQTKTGRDTGKTCTKSVSPTGATSNQGSPGCFHMEGDVSKFNVTIRFVSDGGDGDIDLDLNGGHVGGTNAWNKGTMGSVWTWVPQWTGSPISLPQGQDSVTVNYRGHVRNSAKCPDNYASISCTISKDGSGNCAGTTTSAAPTQAPAANSQTPTPIPTNAPTPTPVCDLGAANCFSTCSNCVSCPNGYYRCQNGANQPTKTPTPTLTPTNTSSPAPTATPLPTVNPTLSAVVEQVKTFISGSNFTFKCIQNISRDEILSKCNKILSNDPTDINSCINQLLNFKNCGLL